MNRPPRARPTVPRWPAPPPSAGPPFYLLPGALHCEAEPTVVTTVLGSCVAVCLSDPVRRRSGINHFVLPRSGSDAASLRYGDVSIDTLVDAMLRLGCGFFDLEAKVFGGAAVLPTNTPANNIGTQNVEIALERLDSLRIPIVARRTGGKTGMAIRLFTETGEVHVRRIASSAQQTNGRTVDPQTE